MRKTLLGAVLVALGMLARSSAAATAPSPDIFPAPPDAESDAADPAGTQGDPLRLRSAPRLLPMPPGTVTSGLPVFFRADAMDGNMRADIFASGHGEVRQRGLVIFADQFRYSVPDERCVAEGNVEIDRGIDRVTGPRADFNLHDQSGSIQEPVLSFASAPDRPRAARATASLAVFPDTSHEHLEQATYTTCVAGRDDWYLTGSAVDLDRTTQIGEASNARIIFQGVPLLYSPYMSFPLNDQRKSGFLAPVLGTTGTNGIDVSVPYYFNIAPNLDDTLTSRVMSKRGLQLSDEFRYLEPASRGVLNAELLDHDAYAGQRRYYLGIQHDQVLPYGLLFHANAQEVSDSNYFRDLSMVAGATSTTYLARDFGLSDRLGAWTLGARALSYQTIQDPTAPIPDQYRALPLLSANYGGSVAGLQFGFQNELADFRHPTTVQGARIVSYPSLTFPLTQDWGFIKPKVGYSYTAYNLDRETVAGDGRHLSRGLPISSIDSGLYFDGSNGLFGKEMLQTLEPRLYYLNIPYRNQDALPLFNTAISTFDFNQLFSENVFSGPDRINAADDLTVALQSRLIDPESGVERVKAQVGERLYFNNQQILIPGENPRGDNLSDFIAGLSGRLDAVNAIESSWDYSPSLRRTEKLGLAWHFTPQTGRTLNLGYRINRDTPGQTDIRQIDVSAEWPLGGHWTGVFRANYDTAQSILVEGLAGAEYTSGCWAFRIVTHRLAVSSVQTTSALFVQLELTGMVKIGTNPLEALKANIPGYAKTNEILR